MAMPANGLPVAGAALAPGASLADAGERGERHAALATTLVPSNSHFQRPR
jgi:hypothetical protein